MYWLANQTELLRKKIPLVISLNSSTLSSYLTPILAQYGIKYTDFLIIFIKEFGLYAEKVFPELFLKDINFSDVKRLSNYSLIVRLNLFLKFTGKYTLEFEKPSISFFMLYFLRKKYKRIRRWKKKNIFFLLYKLTNMLCFIFEKTILTTQLQLTFKNLLNYLYRSGGKRWLALNFEKLKKKNIL